MLQADVTVRPADRCAEPPAARLRQTRKFSEVSESAPHTTASPTAKHINSSTSPSIEGQIAPRLAAKGAAPNAESGLGSRVRVDHMRCRAHEVRPQHLRDLLPD